MTKSLEATMKLHEAIRFAEEKHRGQVRKGTGAAYIIHPLEVLQILMGQGCSMEVAIAGVLHDVLEDTDATAEEVEQRFGPKVLELVMLHTEKKEENGVKRPWRIRKEEDLEKLRSSGHELKQIVMADSISNMRSMVYDYQQVGEKLWDKFKASKEESAWYQREKIAALQEFEENENTRDDYLEMSALFKTLFVD